MPVIKTQVGSYMLYLNISPTEIDDVTSEGFYKSYLNIIDIFKTAGIRVYL
jgi:hypothetical protein